MDEPVFLDFEASSLRDSSYPIEVAWGTSIGTIETHLISPEGISTWMDWAASAEHIHGISRSELLRNGTSPALVAKRLNEVLRGRRVFTDAPGFDGMWPARLNWVILDSDWEAEFCRVAETHPKVKTYIKNHSLGLEVPYRYGSETRRYLPDFIVRVDDGRGDDDLLNLIVEIKGYRREDAKDKKSTMDTYWIPGVNNLKQYGCWAFAEFTEVYLIETDFEAKVEAEFNKMIDGLNPKTV
jgi:hypothetical protein